MLDPNFAVTAAGHVQLTSIDRAVSLFGLLIPAPVNAAISEFKLTDTPLEVPLFLSPLLASLCLSQLTLPRDCSDETQLL